MATQAQVLEQAVWVPAPLVIEVLAQLW